MLCMLRCTIWFVLKLFHPISRSLRSLTCYLIARFAHFVPVLSLATLTPLENKAIVRYAHIWFGPINLAFATLTRQLVWVEQQIKRG